MIFWSLKRNARECFLAIDVGTEAVKAAVFEKSPPVRDGESWKYSVLGAVLEYFDDSRPFDNDKVILKAKDGAVRRAGKFPERILMGLPPNIVRGRVESRQIGRKKSREIINKKEAQSIIDAAFKDSEKNIAKNFSEHSGILPQDIQFINSKILEIKIDGYEVSRLSGYSGEKIDFKVLVNFTPKGYFENFSRIFKGLGLKLKIINPLENLSALAPPEGVFIDIGGEITQICLVKNGRIEVVDEFNVGGRDFSRVISQTLGMRLSDARFFKERYSGGNLSTEARERVKEILDHPLKEWHSELKLKLKNIKGLLPAAFYILGGGSLLSEIEELIVGEGKKTRLLYPEDFKGAINDVSRLNSPQFINLMLISYGS